MTVFGCIAIASRAVPSHVMVSVWWYRGRNGFLVEGGKPKTCTCTTGFLISWGHSLYCWGKVEAAAVPVPQKPAMRALLLSLVLLGLATAQVWISVLKIPCYSIFHVAAKDKGRAKGEWDCFQEMWWNFLWWKWEVMSWPSLQNKTLSHFIKLIHRSHIFHKILPTIHCLTRSVLFSFIQKKTSNNS